MGLYLSSVSLGTDSLEFLSGADIAYFAKDWQKARGCKIEHERAVEYGIPRIDHV